MAIECVLRLPGPPKSLDPNLSLLDEKVIEAHALIG